MLHRRIFDWCPECAGKTGTKVGEPIKYNLSQEKRQALYNQIIDGDYLEHYICPHCGKRIVGISQNFQYEFLLDMALEDFLDMNYRGAYFNFASAEECFIRFFNELVLIDANIDADVVKSILDISKQSTEREYGAFVCLYSLRFGKKVPNKKKNKPQGTTNNIIELRNKVIHRGYRPRPEEVQAFGQFVLDFIFETMSLVKSKFPAETLNEYTDRLLIKRRQEAISWLERNSENTDNVSFATICGSSIASSALQVNGTRKTIEELLKKMHEYRSGFKQHYGVC